MDHAAGADTTGRMFFEHFDAIRIINLKHRVDRRDEMLEELRRIGLENDPRISFHEASKFEDLGSFPSVGARGCFHSHLAILEDAYASGINSILILEDDLDFDRNICTLLPRVSDALQSHDWSIFYGGALQWAGESVAEAPITLADPSHAMMGTHFVGLRGIAIPAAIGYLRAMLDRPAGSPDGGPMHVDGAYSWFRKAHPEVQTFIAVPALGHQRPSRTDVHDLRLRDRIFIIRSGVAMIRKLKRRMV